MSNNKWTEEEVDRLTGLWSAHGREWDGWGHALPGRSWGGIERKARQLGLRRGGSWTREQHVALIQGMRDVVLATGHSGGECADEFIALLRRYGWR